MSQAPDMQVLSVFDDRAALEAAVGKLRGQGIGRDRLTVLGTEEAMRRHLGVEVGRAEGGEAAGSLAGASRSSARWRTWPRSSARPRTSRPRGACSRRRLSVPWSGPRGAAQGA